MKGPGAGGRAVASLEDGGDENTPPPPPLGIRKLSVRSIDITRISMGRIKNKRRMYRRVFYLIKFRILGQKLSKIENVFHKSQHGVARGCMVRKI